MTKEKLKSSLRIKFLILFTVSMLIVLMFPRGESLESEVSVGTIWIQDDLIANFSFPINKSSDTYRKELEVARKSVFPIFIKEDELSKRTLDSLQSYNKFLISIIDSNLSYTQDNFENPTFLTSENFRIFRTLRIKDNQALKQSRGGLKDALILVGKAIKEIYGIGILSLTYEQISRDSIALRQGNVDQIERKVKYLNPETYKTTIRASLNTEYLTTEYEEVMFNYAVHFISPNIVYSPELTQEEIELAQSKVSKFAGIVNENERIVAKHDRVTNEVKLKIDSFRLAKGEMMGDFDLFLQWIGQFLHIFSLLFLFSIYIYLFRKKIYNDNLKLLLVGILITWISFVTFLTNQISVTDSIKLLIFIPAASMLFTIIFDSRVGFYSTIIIALITGALRGNDYTFVVMNVIAGALAVYTVRDIKNRTQIFRSFLFILLGYTTSILIFGFERFESWQKILIEFAFAGTSALISPVLTYGLLIFFEKLFKITTELTLLELSNFDRPLLRDLARKAPGSFSHSLTMGTLVEAAAEKIGANPLLARVGAYYHDIGKTIAPQYFVENQLDNTNLHEELSPSESVKVIINHVRQGIELGKENNLPEEVIDFIPMHHGTTTITYFYEKAKTLYGEENVDVNNFRYPGAKPQTKETALVMLADICESAVRSIDNPDIDKIENLINNLINARLTDGQLDESPLTFADISKIKEAYSNILLGQHHRRIRYPKQEEMEKKD
ncbi:MAG: HDIG domain-containing protein [Ignavibacteria bacterium]|nr:HDIG domain-containing protein [Ignavibacteria bacterium]